MMEIALTADAILVDVRTAEEIGRDAPIEGAIHVDYLREDFAEHLTGFDRWSPLFLYDQTGRRGRLACEMLSALGYANLSWLDGGKDEWDAIFK